MGPCHKDHSSPSRPSWEGLRRAILSPDLQLPCSGTYLCTPHGCGSRRLVHDATPQGRDPELRFLLLQGGPGGQGCNTIRQLRKAMKETHGIES